MTVKEIFTTMDYGPAPESAEPAVAWLARYGRRFDHFIGGRFTPPKGGSYVPTANPATGEVLAEVAQGGERDIDAAVRAARRAYSAWSALSGHQRARYLYAMARHIHKHARLFVVLETLNAGTPIRETRDSHLLVIRHFEHYAGWAELREDRFAGYEPIGVCGQIIPWTYPLWTLARQVAPALAAGNTVVLKPSELTPLTALRFAELCQEIGLPPGVVNIVTGDGDTGAWLVKHPGVAKLAFTGSTEVGKRIRSESAGGGKQLTLALGGTVFHIVFDDADLDSAAESIVDAIWVKGHVGAGSRLLVQEGIAASVYAKLRARMETLRVGDPLDRTIDLGAIIPPGQRHKIQALVARSQAEGADCWQPSWAKGWGSEDAAGPSLPNAGCVYPPTLITKLEPADTVAQIEILGPVLIGMTFRTPAEAVALANTVRYGLAASIWTETIDLALDVASRLKAGVVWINGTNRFDTASGLGGYRESGFGREGGLEGMEDYLVLRWEKALGRYRRPAPNRPRRPPSPEPRGGGEIDHTPKLYIGGKQVRPNSGHSRVVHDARGRRAGEVGEGDRKDVHNAVEAAHKASGWAGLTGHRRAQVLYDLAETLAVRSDRLAEQLVRLTGVARQQAAEEVQASHRRLLYYAACADKIGGYVHRTAMRAVRLAMPEPLGVMGIVCPDEAPLLSLISLAVPPVALGNCVVVIPSERYPLIATALYPLLDTSDLPGGVVNIVTGERERLAQVLAEHDNVAAVWYVGSAAGSAMVERASASTLKQTWVNNGRRRDWFDVEQGQGGEYLRRTTQIKSIWLPYGE